MWFAGWTAIGRVVVLTVVAYVALTSLIRVFGKRTISKMNPGDFVVTVAIGPLAAARRNRKRQPARRTRGTRGGRCWLLSSGENCRAKKQAALPPLSTLRPFRSFLFFRLDGEADSLVPRVRNAIADFVH